MARGFQAAGAECLHVIDLGAAFGEPDSTSHVLEIASTVDLPLQTGGGIRDEERVARLLDGGVARVILGTRALREPSFLANVVSRYGKERVVVALDCEGRRLKLSGREEESALDIDGGVELARSCGADRLLVTATDRDGTLSGPRLDLYRGLLTADGLRVIAAGGIGELNHVRALLNLHHPALEGIVVGRALYEGTVELGAAIALARSFARKEPPR